MSDQLKIDLSWFNFCYSSTLSSVQSVGVSDAYTTHVKAKLIISSTFQSNSVWRLPWQSKELFQIAP